MGSNRPVVGAIVIALVLCLSLVIDSVGAEESGDVIADPTLDGRPIVRIEFVRNNIFDPTDPSMAWWPYRAANAIHVVTRERFLRSMVLFEEGDAWSRADAAESARILRSLGFINPVYIRARAEGEGVAVTVETHDQWTLEVGASFGVAGNRDKWSVEFNEFNFLGTGREVNIHYTSDHERSAWTYSLFDPNIFGSRWRARVKYSDASDGRRTEAFAEYPFYSVNTPRAGGGFWKQWEQIEHLYVGGESAVEGQRDYELLHLWYGLRLPSSDDGVQRLKVGYHLDERIFTDWRFEDDGRPFQTPDDVTISGPRVSYHRFNDTYTVLTGFRAWSAQEDVLMGPTASAGLTWSAPAFGGDIQRIVLDAQWNTTRRWRDWIVLGGVWASGRFDEGSARNWVGGMQLAASQLGDRGWQARIVVEDSYQLDREAQLTLGADVGLRGWDPDYFDGTGRALVNVQWRTLLKRDFLNLFSVGLVAFGDAGTTWSPRVGFDTDGIRGNVGVGLLADLTHLSLANLLRLDVAVPDDGSGVTVIVTSQALF
jgi:hypothetical protein